MGKKVVSIRSKIAKKATSDRRLADQRDREEERTIYRRAIAHLRMTPGFEHIEALLRPVIEALDARAASLANYKPVDDPAEPTRPSRFRRTPSLRADVDPPEEPEP